MKLSFSISSKSSSSRPPTSKPPQSLNPSGNRNHEDDHHDETKPNFVTVFDPSEKPSSDSTLRVIAPIQNTNFRSNMKMKNIPLPTADEPSAESRFVLDTSGNGSSKSSQYGLILRSNVTEAKTQEGDARMSEKRRSQDLRVLPDEELPDVPVDGFGDAILAGYGWVEGKPIGRNSNVEDPKVFELQRRASADWFAHAPQETKLSNKSQKEEISAGFKSVHDKDFYTDDRDERKFESRERKKTGKDRRNEKTNKQEKRRKHDVTTTAVKCPVRWLKNHIRVRIISKEFGGGKLYLKKGVVVDVASTTCDIKMDESKELVQGVDQEILETALPKRGGSVLVLYGKHKGVYGSLVERDSEKETGLVRDAGSHALINVLLEHIAEYVGNPSHLGY